MVGLAPVQPGWPLLCHLVKAPDPWYGEQGLWWLAWPLCSLVGSFSAPGPLASHCAPSVWERLPWHLCSLASALPCPARGHPRGARPSTPGAHAPCLICPGPKSRTGAFCISGRVWGLSVSVVHFLPSRSPACQILNGLKCQCVCLLLQTELLRRTCLCLPASSRAQWLSELLCIECHGRCWRSIFRIAVLKLVCKTL